MTVASTLAEMARPLLFVRHGATAPNLDGLRCGGDLDVPMTTTGRAQIAQAADALRRIGRPIDLIIASDLLRTRESAQIVSGVLGGVPLEIDADWRERALGTWNLCPIGETEAALRADEQPPGGESNAVFTARIRSALAGLQSRVRSGLPLLVGSRGVARVLRETLDCRSVAPVDNGEVLCFDLAAMPVDLDHFHRTLPTAALAGATS
jgi:2,3-bisphosphoglycerate-dependent phosphoglycerate mutase